jgi:hypothetical protein
MPALPIYAFRQPGLYPDNFSLYRNVSQVSARFIAEMRANNDLTILLLMGMSHTTID